MLTFFMLMHIKKFINVIDLSVICLHVDASRKGQPRKKKLLTLKNLTTRTHDVIGIRNMRRLTDTNSGTCFRIMT